MCAVTVAFELELHVRMKNTQCKVLDKMMATDNPLSKRNKLEKRARAGFYVTEN